MPHPNSRDQTRRGLVLFAAVIVVLVLGFFHSSENSDALYMEVFQSDYQRDIALGDRWFQMPASAYFPDQLVYFLARMVLPVSGALFALSAVKVLLLGSAMSFFCQRALRIERSRSYLYALIVLALLIAPFKTGMFPLFRIEMNHFSGPFFALILAGWLFAPTLRMTLGVGLGAFVMGIAAATSSPASVLILGVFGGSILLVQHWALVRPWPLRHVVDNYRALFATPSVVTFFVFCAGLLSGFVIYQTLINPGFMGERLWANNDFASGAGGVGHKLERGFGLLHQNIRAVLFSHVTALVAIAIAIVIAAARGPRRVSAIPTTAKHAGLSALIAFALTFLAFSVSGGVIDPGFARYFYAAQILLMLVALHIIDHARRLPFTGIAVVLVGASVYAYRPDFSVERDLFRAQPSVAVDTGSLASCVNQHVKLRDDDARVVVGVLNYWNANAAKIGIVDDRVDIVTMSSGGGAMIWMQNVYTAQSRIDGFYLAVGRGEDYLFPIEGQQTLNCPGAAWSLIDFGSQTRRAIDFVRAHSVALIAQVDTRSKNGLWFANWLPSTIEGAKSLHGVTEATGPGLVHDGPQLGLEPGDYEAQVFYSLEVTSPDGRYETFVECSDRAGHTHQIARTDLVPGIGISTRLAFSVGAQNDCASGYTLRSWIDPGARMQFNFLALTQRTP